MGKEAPLVLTEYPAPVVFLRKLSVPWDTCVPSSQVPLPLAGPLLTIRDQSRGQWGREAGMPSVGLLGRQGCLEDDQGDNKGEWAAWEQQAELCVGRVGPNQGGCETGGIVHVRGK